MTVATYPAPAIPTFPDFRRLARRPSRVARRETQVDMIIRSLKAAPLASRDEVLRAL